MVDQSATANDCPSCGITTSPEFQFCPSCGVALQPSGPDGAAARPETAAHPGHPTAEERPRPLAERRLVSVLFLDLVGFTTLSESLDPEDVREIQSRYFEAARSTVSHYGGSLEKFIGDAVMAVWGTPIAHEDDGERAVRAALEIVAAVMTISAPGVGGHLTARGAVATGEVAVTLNAEGQGMVTGDLVNTTSRLQDAAAPGTVLIDAATHTVVGQAIGVEPAGELSLKGKAAPVAAWRATGVAEHAGSESRTGHRGPFVGRTAEIRGLREQLATIGSERRLRVVSLVGIAGIGKSRLAWELQHGDAASTPEAAWYSGRAPGYGEGIAFAPLAEMVRRSAGIAESDPAEVARRAIREVLGRFVADAAEREWIEPRVLALLEPGQTAGADREELFAAWRRYLEAQAETAPLVLLFEDLQWADSGMLDFIDYLADWSRHSPVLVLTLGRPELLDARPTWGAGLPHFTAMHLERLPDAAIDELLGSLAPGLPDDVTRRVRERADGVPLYAVELARMLTERDESRRAASVAPPPSSAGAGSIEIPESLHALIAARIDALPPAERSLLLTAAVLGRRFRPEALGAISGATPEALRERLRALLRREFLAMDDDPRSPGRGQLSFVQELVREVAYHTLSRRERRAQHLAVVAYLESVGEPDLVEPIAEHLLAAHGASPGDPDEGAVIAGRARGALQQAAERAQALHAPARALAHLERALELTGDPADRANLAESAGLAARAAARFGVAEGHLREAIDLRSSLGDSARASRHRAQLASLLLQAQRSDTALAELEAAWRVVAANPEEAAGAAQVPAELARAHLLRGEPARAVEWADRAISAAESGGTPDLVAIGIDARVTLGTARAGVGEIEQGMAQLRQAIEDARGAGLGSVQLRALNNLAWLTVTDDPRATSDMARPGIELAQRLGNREMVLQLLDIASIVAIEVGAWEWAGGALEEASATELPSSYRLDFAATRAIIGALLGAPQAAEPIDDLGSLEPDLDPEAVGWVEHARALIALVSGDLPRAIELARSSGPRMTGYERGMSLALAGRAAAWARDPDAAADALAAFEREAGWGRAWEATLHTLRAAVGAVSGGEDAEAMASTEWDQATRIWRDLDLPLPLGLCHLDRWLLARRPEDRTAATAIFTALDAAPLLELARSSG